MTNEILDEIRRVRDEMARESNYDIDVYFQKLRAGTEQRRLSGWPVVSSESSAMILQDKADGLTGQ